jgi:teichuronic acid biosynthesis glycosyltransferase TuaC
MVERSAKAIADSVHALFGPRMPTRESTRAYASAFSWDATTRGQIDLFRRVIAKAGAEV